MGRDFRPDDDRVGAAPTVIIGYSVWKNRYNGDPGILTRIDQGQQPDRVGRSA